jgi:membrane-bound ClpP family serine protease
MNPNPETIYRLYVFGLSMLILAFAAFLALGVIELALMVPALYEVVVANRLASFAVAAGSIGAGVFGTAIYLDTRDRRRKIGGGR